MCPRISDTSNQSRPRSVSDALPIARSMAWVTPSVDDPVISTVLYTWSVMAEVLPRQRQPKRREAPVVAARRRERQLAVDRRDQPLLREGVEPGEAPGVAEERRFLRRLVGGEQRGRIARAAGERSQQLRLGARARPALRAQACQRLPEARQRGRVAGHVAQ